MGPKREFGNPGGLAPKLWLDDEAGGSEFDSETLNVPLGPGMSLLRHRQHRSSRTLATMKFSPRKSSPFSHFLQKLSMEALGNILKTSGFVILACFAMDTNFFFATSVIQPERNFEWSMRLFFRLFQYLMRNVIHYGSRNSAGYGSSEGRPLNLTTNGVFCMGLLQL